VNSWPKERIIIVSLDIHEDTMSSTDLPAACAKAGLGAPHRDGSGRYWAARGPHGIRDLVARKA